MDSQYKVTDACGAHVVPGTLVYDFRGDHAVFQFVSRGPDPLLGTLAKVTVERTGMRKEYFARTFGLTVESAGAEG